LDALHELLDELDEVPALVLISGVQCLPSQTAQFGIALGLLQFAFMLDMER
jgi:hypothetical protein